MSVASEDLRCRRCDAKLGAFEMTMVGLCPQCALFKGHITLDQFVGFVFFVYPNDEDTVLVDALARFKKSFWIPKCRCGHSRTEHWRKNGWRDTVALGCSECECSAYTAKDEELVS